MTEDEKLRRSVAAEALQSNEAYTDAMKALRDEVHKSWASAPMRDIEGQQALKMMLKVIDSFEAQIESYVGDGKLIMDNRRWFEREQKLKVA